MAEEKGADTASLRHIVACVDGSEIAHKAFEVANTFFTRRDFVTVLHCAVPGKEYLAHDLQPSRIAETYDVEMVSTLPRERYEVEVYERPEGMTTRQAVVQWINQHNAYLMVVGCAGRKGPKTDPTVLGSTADYSLRGTKCSSAIVKPKSEVPKSGEPVSFVVCVDGSPGGDYAFKLATELAQKERGDTVQVVYVATDEGRDVSPRFTGDAIRGTFMERCSAAGYGEDAVVTLDKEPGCSTATTLVEYCNNTAGPHVVVLGADGVTAHTQHRRHLGSVSDFVVRRAWATVIVAQDPGN